MSNGGCYGALEVDGSGSNSGDSASGRGTLHDPLMDATDAQQTTAVMSLSR